MKTLKKTLFTATAEQASSKEEENGSRRKRDNKSFADNLEERLIDFAVRIIKLSASLPKSAAGRHIAGQILRCGLHLHRIMGRREEPKAGLILFIRSALS